MSSAIRSTQVRRGAYRVRPESLEELDLAVLEKRYRVVRGYVADVACGGVQVQFRQGNVPALEPDAAVLLAIASDRYDFDATLRARIVSALEHEHGPLFRFAFEPGSERLLTERGELFGLFNRRADYRRRERRRAPRARISPEGGKQGSGQDIAVSVRNLSSRGAGLSAAPAVPRWLQETGRLVLGISLPGSPTEDRIACRLRRWSGEGNAIACEFDWTHTLDAESAAQRVQGYIADRLKEDQRLSPDRRFQRA